MQLFAHQKRKLLFVGFMFSSLISFSQLNDYSFEQIDSLQKTEQRNILVFIHADWCKFCLLMENTTFKDEKVVEMLNKHFWFISLNAEEKKDIFFNQTLFQYKSNGYNTGIHELAEQLGTIGNKLIFPTICILNSNHEIIFQTGQFLSAKDLVLFLNNLGLK